MAEEPVLIDYTDYPEGYRDGYVAGYDKGIEDGRFQGYRDAKYQAFRAAGMDNEMREVLEHALGEE